MQTIIRLSGKAEQIFKYLDLLIQRYGNITLAQLEKEVKNEDFRRSHRNHGN